MKLSEQCSCGAEFTLTGFVDQNVHDMAAHWRAHHVCPNRVRSLTPRATRALLTPEGQRQLQRMREQREVADA